MLNATSSQYYPLAPHTLFASYAWPARSPDLSPLYYYVEAHERHGLAAKSQTREELLQHIMEYADHINRNGYIFRYAVHFL